MPSGSDTEAGGLHERVREAIAGADVGAEDLLAGIADLGGVGEVAVDGGTARVAVTLPVPAAGFRERIERGIEAAATGVAGVEAVAVDWRPAPADPGARVDVLPDVKNVVAVASGKGGVGKSTVAANVAVALADAGASVGLLDADVYGPNAPAMLGLGDAAPEVTAEGDIVPREAHGVRTMSLAFVVGEDDPVIWRGPMVNDVLEQLFRDVRWGALDYLIVDLPPGTGDAQLTLVQHLPVAGAVVVTTPQGVAVDDARVGLRALTRYDVPILGVVENMREFACPDCGGVHDVFGTGGAEALAAEFEVPVLGGIPLDPGVGDRGDGADGPSSPPPGVTLPIVGRVGLPRTEAERSGGIGRPPIAVRESGGEPRRAFRELATRTAARANLAARRV